MYNTALVERKAALDAREKDLQSREKEFTKKHDADSRKLRKLTVVQDLLKKSLDTERTELEARKKKFDTEAAGLETRKKEVEELATLLSETRTNIEIQKKAIEETLTRHHQAAAEFNLHQERFSKARIQFEEREKGGLQRDAGVEVERKRLSLLEIGLNNRGVLSREWEAKVKDRECGLRYQETSCGLRENLVGEADKAAKSQHEALMVREMELTDRERGLTERENEVEKRETCSLGEVVGCDGEDDVGDMGDESLNDEDDFVVVKEEDFDSDFDFCEDE
ncbi:hypothetical protein EJ08DRAFT_387212 [Tothia fuscella]|uniref:Uncharacterized protein n=1 Tax=Tothia fuscella TaxID=1048955 RepID=A0A9P4P098_9PEZI|nr:hypothetical protein EJ08DRAFT_387212 [Tothia fuscella]